MERCNLHDQKHASCSKSAAGLLPCSRQANIGMHLLRPDDNRSAAICEQALNKFAVNTILIRMLDASCFNNCANQVSMMKELIQLVYLYF